MFLIPVRWFKCYGLLLGLLVYLWGSPYSLEVQAAEKLITAVFSPDVNNPSHNKFVNTTPNEGYCAIYPSECVANSTFSIYLPFRVHASQNFIPGEAAADARKGAYFVVPSAYRVVSVVNDKTGAISELKVRIAGMGQAYHLNRPVSGNHRQLWSGGADGNWVNPPAPCLYSGVGSYGPYNYLSFWKYPVTASAACVKRPLQVITMPFWYDSIVIAYELITPDPLGMDIGSYSGSISYSIGPYGDFDFGDVMVPNDNQVTLNFQLQVNHYLAVDFPAGAYRAVLQPKGGWQGWLNSGRPAPALNADHQFKISSSGRFKVYLDCEYSVAGTCGIQAPLDNGADPVAVDISVTLPVGIVAVPGDRPANRIKLGIGVSNAAEFRTAVVQFSRAATMHYEIPAAVTAEMAKNPGKTYRGGATIIFDGNI